MNEAMMKELEDPDTLLIARLPMDVKRFAALAGLFARGEAVVKAMPAGCQWTVIKKSKGAR
jgi:phosphopantetheinyl transferase (holo-ACP synthase)